MMRFLQHRVLIIGDQEADRAQVQQLLRGNNMRRFGGQQVLPDPNQMEYVQVASVQAAIDDPNTGDLESYCADVQQQLGPAITQGVHAVVLVMRRGALLAGDKSNYTLFVERLCQSQVPCVAVILGCEREGADAIGQADHVQAALRNQGVNVGAVVQAAAVEGGRFEGAAQPLRQQTREAVIEAIRTHARAHNQPFVVEANNIAPAVRAIATEQKRASSVLGLVANSLQLLQAHPMRLISALAVILAVVLAYIRSMVFQP
ncbi:hypothetical protein PTSG_10907 [Salpingoeca rosetta]|uniref:Uncharacterized protein n=1 Tax=Salpingoeca rosetta (strain ATCC 50818 / BSB-021) TaxID=946362 RepID=F2URC5_SALR5|nr:uncharacterized protein PTSG_10907 [Salpingoeca rosetta]EGD80228.1 hypothetical protein PTSG_10907 [Salpingoeca rosetta]|eukprot:XP_004988290.1 hypothetical protein PTSG_10907 [Salpingoeca rosetta]